MQQPPVASEKILKSSAVISDKPTAILYWYRVFSLEIFIIQSQSR